VIGRGTKITKRTPVHYFSLAFPARSCGFPPSLHLASTRFTHVLHMLRLSVAVRLGSDARSRGVGKLMARCNAQAEAGGSSAERCWGE
jgi:hypothetical protein